MIRVVFNARLIAFNFWQFFASESFNFDLKATEINWRDFIEFFYFWISARGKKSFEVFSVGLVCYLNWNSNSFTCSNPADASWELSFLPRWLLECLFVYFSFFSQILRRKQRPLDSRHRSAEYFSFMMIIFASGHKIALQLLFCDVQPWTMTGSEYYFFILSSLNKRTIMKWSREGVFWRGFCVGKKGLKRELLRIRIKMSFLRNATCKNSKGFKRNEEDCAYFNYQHFQLNLLR